MHMVAYAAERLISGTLDRLAVDLQLNETQFIRATQGYSGVTTWLAAEASPLRARSPYLFPQGSLALDTTVRPILSGQFDLDVICRIALDRSHRPDAIYQLIWDRMYDHGTYRPLMEQMPRCIRLNYAEDSQFHLDIVPAIPDPQRGGTFILIPDGSGDREGMTWKSANPQGFGSWFEKQKAVVEAKFARARIEPLGKPLPAEQKAALTKCVQLFKRWRDVRWADDPDCATPSIVLTFVAASLYQGQGSIAEAFDAILDGLVQFVDSGEKKLINPANDREVITEKWLRKSDCHEAFVEGVRSLRADWDDLLEISNDGGRGIPAFTDKLRELFGEPGVGAVKAATGVYSDARANGTLQVDKKTGAMMTNAPAAGIAASTVRVKPNTHFGD